MQVQVQVQVQVPMLTMQFSRRPCGCSLPFEARGLVKSYRSGDTQILALAGVDLDTCRGELVVADTGTGYRVVPSPGRHGVWMDVRRTSAGN